jgi:Carboxypeptidase regulatory-like domain
MKIVRARTVFIEAMRVFTDAVRVGRGNVLIIAERYGNWAASIVGRCLLIAILCFVTVRLVHGQSGTATLSGITIDESGASLADVRVIAANAATGLQHQITSDAEGGFVIRMLPPGRYAVTAERVGFASARQGSPPQRK